jgi:hypothetical protein
MASNLTQKLINWYIAAMVVRIRFSKGPKVAEKRRKNRRVALATAGLLTPAAFLVGVVGVWRLTADLGFTAGFAISSGIFSHWQVWLASAVLLEVFARLLNRYGKSEDAAVS